MLRAILRNIQNTLVLSSVLLVCLAMQRLRTFDYFHQPHHHHPKHHPFENHPQDQESDSEDLSHFRNEHLTGIEFDPLSPYWRISSRHPVVLGREFHIGLFRFVLPQLPRLEEASPVVAATGPSSKHSQDVASSEWKVDTSNSKRQRAPDVAILVTMEERGQLCSSRSLRAALALYKSFTALGDKSVRYELHALVQNATVDSTSAMSSCASRLANIGYHVISPQNLDPHGCLRKSATATNSGKISSNVEAALLRVHAVHLLDTWTVDSVIYAPLPFVLVNATTMVIPSHHQKDGDGKSSNNPQRQLRVLSSSSNSKRDRSLLHGSNCTRSDVATTEAASWEKRTCEHGLCRISSQTRLAFCPWECLEKKCPGTMLSFCRPSLRK